MNTRHIVRALARRAARDIATADAILLGVEDAHPTITRDRVAQLDRRTLEALALYGRYVVDTRGPGSTFDNCRAGGFDVT